VVEDVQVEQFRMEKSEGLLRFLRVAYAGEARKSEPAYWKWHYLENPNTTTDDLPVWVAVAGEEIVGQLATIPVPIKVGGETRPAIWILDFIVREDFRGKGLGKRLVMAARARYPTTITLGINRQSAGLFQSMGWVEMGWIHRYQKLLYAGNGLKGAARIAPVRGLLNLMSRPMRREGRRALRLGRYTVGTIGAFGAEFDELWERASGPRACAARRDARTLRWQFQQQPGKRFETVGLYDQERLVGYVVLFFRKGLASAEANAGTVAGPAKAAISDFFYEREHGGEIVDALIEVALARAIELRAGSLVTDVLDGLAEQRLKKHGFWRIRKSPQFMACAEEAKEIIYDPQNWFLTRGDSDVSIIEEPNLE
jgi:GNAT superfamily N-acetyltransferase